MAGRGGLVAVGRGSSVAVGAAPDSGVEGVRAGEVGVSVGVDAVRVGDGHAGRLIRAAGRERRRKGQRKDDAQQGYVSCRACTGHFLTLPFCLSPSSLGYLARHSGRYAVRPRAEGVWL